MTDSAGFARLAVRFEELRELSADQREQRLEEIARASPGDAAALRRLLALHAADDDALAAPEQALPPTLVAAAWAAAGAKAYPPPQQPALARVGAYRLVRLLGRGGMGEVHLAEREGADFRQQVAVKLLRHDFAGDRLLQRFRTERRILAGLRHPNIAALLDGGTTDDGRPFVVMEYVDGTDLATYCTARRLDLQARLRLFLRVLAAVDHAHRNLIVHRDLKPGNILVTAAGEPKLLDFGIAKLLDPAAALDDDVDRTGAATLLLTPEYCSPEQVRGEPITTATDVYALGTILYELLTGQRAQRPTTRSITALAKAVCEESPPAPSTAALSAGPGAPPELPPRRLAQRLRGDLDTIVACALRKEPARRYGQAEALADDLRRYLDGLPVRARADTFGYRAQKFVRRNRLAVAAAAVLLALTAVFVAHTLQQNELIRRQRDVADAERKEAVAARALAERQRNAATAIADFLVGLYEMAEPDPERANQLRARQLLDRGRARIDADLAQAPQQRALLQTAMGRAYLSLGLPDDAEPLLQNAAAALAADDADPVARAELQHFLGQLEWQRGRYPAAEARLRQAIEGRTGDTAAARKHRVRSRLLLSAMLREVGRFDDAGAELEQAAQDLAPIAADEPRAAADVHTATAALRTELGRYDEALALLAEARELLTAAFGPEHPTLANLLREFGETYEQAGRLDEARAALEQALAHDRRIGDSNPDVDTDLFQLASVEMEAGRFDRAEELFLEVLRRDRERFGQEHPYVALDLGQLAGVCSRRGDFARAEQLYADALAMQRRVLPADHPELATTMANLGSLYNRTERHAEALPLFEQALAMRLRLFPTDHPTVLTSRNQLAVLAYARGDVAAAEAQFREILDARRRTLGDHPQVAGSLLSLATAVAQQGRFDEAAPLLEESVAMFRRTLPPLHLDLARSLYMLGMLRLRGDDAAAAEPLLREALRCREPVLPPGNPDLLRCQRSLAQALVRLDRGAEAVTLLRAALEAVRAAGAGGPALQALTEDLAAVHEQLGEHDRAAAVRAGR
ncbi:MAG: tetratricopeptide repeat protein [Planctomycetota bacterium]